MLELGSKAFALSLIADEVDNELPNINRTFLHDPSNFNFVHTPQGDLGTLLRDGRCLIGDPVGVDYLPLWGSENPKQGDFWRVQLSVNCDVSGPRYFTHDGIIVFMKSGEGPWQPETFFASRISKYRPGAWFDQPEPAEQEIYDIGKKALERADQPTPEKSPFTDH